MTCEGCANAVKRILGKLEGVTAVTTDVATKTVVVTGGPGGEAMVEALSKWAAAANKTVALA